MGEYGPGLDAKPARDAEPAAETRLPASSAGCGRGIGHGRPLSPPADGRIASVIPGLRPFAALDLGTNNCRLLVAHVSDDNLRVVDAFSRIVRLGGGVASSGQLSEAAMDRTLDALRICARKIRRWQVAGTRAVATEACRRAENGPAFIDRVRTETGLTIEIVDPQEEARLALAGCASLLEPSRPRAIVFDIGGGSTEVSWVALAEGQAPRLIASHSVPLGVVGLAETFGADRLSAEAYAAMVRQVRIGLVSFDRDFAIAEAVARDEVMILGSSGTVTTLGAILLQLPRYDRSLVDGTAFPRDSMLAISRSLALMDVRERAGVPCIGRERADLVVAGCAILDALLDLWPIETVRIADRGVREGILFGLAAAMAGSARSGRELR